MVPSGWSVGEQESEVPDGQVQRAGSSAVEAARQNSCEGQTAPG